MGNCRLYHAPTRPPLHYHQAVGFALEAASEASRLFRLLKRNSVTQMRDPPDSNVHRTTSKNAASKDKATVTHQNNTKAQNTDMAYALDFWTI